MARILLCSTPLAGHVGPMTAVGHGMVERGHEVIMVTGSRFANHVTDAGLTMHPLAGIADFDERDPDSFLPDRDHHRGLALSRYQVENTFVRPLLDQAAAVNEVIDTGDIGAVLCDGTFAGIVPLLSRSRDQRPPVMGLGTMPLAQTSRDVAPFNSGLRPMPGLVGTTRNRIAHQVVRRGMFASTQRYAAGLVGAAGGRLDHFILDLSSAFDRFFQLGPAEFEYTRSDLAENTVFVGPVGGADRQVTQPQWWPELLADQRPIVHVTQGTLDNHDFSQLIEPAIEGLGDADVQVVVTTGGADPDGIRLASNTRIARFLDYDALLPRTAVMVTNGGYGGVLLALRHAVPVIVAPGAEDKPEVAVRVQHFGVGIDLRTRRPQASSIADATIRVLANDSVKRSCLAMAEAIATYAPLSTIANALHDELDLAR
ncbi:glycosyltransferase [Gordonia polyisoprenivorans]|uniref:glycosyltransferase n=1 Tax=Gordonia polyisoprenivorans TaxID=84595 RepID=UPI001AD685CC|nr:nucleotide disphospho-sugar-binding domain-containing protein [Gordonia polyisoprenivorans]QTI69299.1 glycosyltransferase [Gordonia polyisoprenivorans]